MVTRETEDWTLAVLGRPEHPIPVPQRFGRVMVTGSAGSLGGMVQGYVADRCEDLLSLDIATDEYAGDITNREVLCEQVESFKPDVIFHLAGYKHAPAGEEDPYGAMIVNVDGTRNVLDAAEFVGAEVVVASTCKACDPETSYGASKLIAERLALNAGQRVVRFYNVVETSGNVFEIWENIPGDESLPVTTCARRFLTAQEALNLTLWASTQDTGRYMIADVRLRSMIEVARSLYPNRVFQMVKPRRGDRMIEPEYAQCERVACLLDGWVAQIESPHDPVRRD